MLQKPLPQPTSRMRCGGLLAKACQQTGPPKSWKSMSVRSVCRCNSARSTGSMYGSVGSERYLRLFRTTNGRVATAAECPVLDRVPSRAVIDGCSAEPRDPLEAPRTDGSDDMAV